MRSNSNNVFPLLLIFGAALLSLSGSKRFVPPVRKGKVSSGFGERINPITKKKEFHNGIDIAVPEGTKVFAIDSGKVSNVYNTSEGGLQIIVRNDSGMISGYAHLNKSVVKIGDKVSRGEEIALSGKTGQTTGAHLHFSLRDENGKYIDPVKSINLS